MIRVRGIIKLLLFIRADHVTYVIEAGVSLDDDFLSGRLAVVLSFLGPVLFCLSSVRLILRLPAWEEVFSCASAHTPGFVSGPDDSTKTAK